MNYDMLTTMYNACMNISEIVEVGPMPLHTILEDIVEIFSDDETDYTSTVGDANLYFAKMGWSTIVNIGPGIDDLNPVRNNPRV